MSKKIHALLALLLVCSLALTCLPAPALAAKGEEAQLAAADAAEKVAEDSSDEEVEGTAGEAAADSEEDNSTEEETVVVDEAEMLFETEAEENSLEETDSEAGPEEGQDEAVETTWTTVTDSTEIARLIRDNWSDDYFQEAVVDTRRNRVTVDGESAEFSEVFDDVTEAEEDEIFASADAVEEYFADTAYETETQSNGAVSVTAPYQTCRILLTAKRLTEDYGAVTILEYSAYDEYVLQFATAEDTQAAYEQLVTCYGAENCFVDEIITADDLFLSDGEDETTSTSSWGCSYMGLDTLKASVSSDNAAVTVAIIDSGIDPDHEFFEGRTITEDSYNFLAEEDEDPTELSDPYGHGTHVAGIIAECTPDNVELMVLRILDDNGSGTLALVSTAIQYALEHGADVMNLSLGVKNVNAQGNPYTYLDGVIQTAYEAGVPLCCAAGNAKTDVYYPAANELTLAVSAIQSDGSFASNYSNYGEEIDFCAPGTSIVSAASGGGTTSKSGTSMASAFLTAAFTYVITACPDATVDEMYSALQSRTTDLGDGGKDAYYGWGCVTGLASLFVSFEDLDLTVTLPQNGYTYDGSAKEPAVTVADAEGNPLAEGTDYKVSYRNNTNAGTATVTVTGIGNYTGSVDKTFTIAKSSQTVTATAAAASIYAGKTTTVTGKGAGTITYSSSDTSVATVSSSGVVTGKKPGTVTITVKAAGNDNYKSATKTVKITVKLNKTTISSLTNTSSGITVKWSEVTGASGYYIYRNGKQVKKITSGSTISYTDTGAKTNGTKYQYKIYAYYGSTKSAVSATKTTYFVSRPTISSLKNVKTKKMTVKWKKNTKATGYQIQYSTSSDFSSYKTVTVSSYKTVSKTISSLTKGKKYYVRVRAYKTVSGTKYYAAWSSKKNVKISK